MFGIGFEELVVILIVALIVVGPENLPRIAKALGRAVAEFQKAMEELKETVESNEAVREFKKEFEKVKRGINKPFSEFPEEKDKENE